MINGFLSSVGYPKSALFDADKPVESSAALTDYVSERYLGTKIQSRQYIEPVYSYLKVSSLKKLEHNINKVSFKNIHTSF